MKAPGFEGVIVRKDGARLIVEPIARPSLLDVLDRLKPIEIELPDVDRDLPPLDDVAI